MQDPSVIDDKIANAPADLALERAPDIVEALNARAPEEAAEILQRLPSEKAVEVLDQPGLDNICEMISALPVETAIALLGSVAADRAADIFRELLEPLRSTLLNGLSPENRKT